MRIEFYLLRIVSELLVLLKIIYNLIWKGERGREHAGTIGWFIPQLSEAAFGLEPRSAARNPSGSPTWMDGMNSTTQVVTLLPSTVHISRDLQPGTELGLQPRHASVG